MSRSLSVRDDCIGKAKLALKRNGFHSQRSLAESVGFSLSTVGNFLRGKPVDVATFTELCTQLGLDWQTISTFENKHWNSPQDELVLPKQSAARTRYQDWGEAIDVSIFYGRSPELHKLQTWILNDDCRLITILGMGGVGKTTLSVKLAQQLQDQFDTVIFRSLRNAPPLQPFLINLIQVLSHHQDTHIYNSLSDLLSRLVQYLQDSCCLLVIDNAESILASCNRTGAYRTGYEEYGQLLQLVGKTPHKSCLILTSREKPQGLNALEGDRLPVRCLQIQGLSTQAGREIFNSVGTYTGADQDWFSLTRRYAGNPLALKIIASFVRDVFESDLSGFLNFLNSELFIFDDIRDLLDQQFQRLSPIETEVMHWLAINREPVSYQDLQADIFSLTPMGELLQAIAALQHRSLIEKSVHHFTLQPVVMEYMTAKLIQQVTESILQNQVGCLSQYPLVKAQASVSISETQRCLILQPIVDNLLSYFRTPTAITDRLFSLLTRLRGQSTQATGYFCGNLLHFAQQLEVDISGYDFSGLTLWQANLQGMPLHNTNFANADFSNVAFSEVLDEVKALAFSPNGQCLAIADQDCKVRVWCTRTYQQLWVGQEHQNAVLSVAFSPDSQSLISASADHTLKLWNVETGTCVHTFEDHQSEVCAVAFSPNGQSFASGSKDCTVKVWDINRGQCQQTLQGHQQAVFTVAFNTDGSLIASGSSDKTIKLWNVETGTCQQTLQGHTNWVMSVAFAPHTQRLASCSTDKTIKFWNYNSGECIQTLHSHRNWVLSIAFSPDGSQLVSSSGDQTVKLWEVKSGICLQTLSGHDHGIVAVAFHPHGHLVASGSHDQTMRLWHPDTGACLKVLTGYTNRIFAVACSPDGHTLASGSFDQSIRLWNRQQGQVMRSLKGHHHPVYSLAFSPKDQTLASGGGDYAIKLWHYPTGQCLSTLTGHRGWVYALAYSPDGDWLVSGASDHTVKVWRISTEDCVMTLTGHQTWIWSVAVSPDGSRVASGSGDRTIKLWEAQTGACLHTLREHQDRVYSVAFSPDGQFLASGSFDHTIKVWEVETGECRQHMMGHTNGVYTVAFSPDGRLLASGSLDHTIKLWDLSTGRCIGTFEGHENEVRSLVFLPPLSSKDKAPLQLASGSQDQTLRIWQVPTGECQGVLKVKPLYDGMNITGTTGLTMAQKASLKALGAVESRDQTAVFSLTSG
ncbi:NB-ARC domain-containing protein [Acaryochloris sp. IP29b_bin.148]|uniref:WD40 domain-containing protein n=1 Tax=Acaryochloris sp. IP29b_bin.148 TaxID=2969218 RepID=UPI002630258F|nr:NB-ARC domain-containing protein [Acaryochloris sp. IP29b_bin.148]